MAMPKKIAGVKTPVAIAALTLLVVGFLYLRHRNSVQGSSAAPLASTADTGLGAGGGAVSTPTDNGLGSTTVGTDAMQTQLWDSILSAYQISAQANADMAAHAGTYTNIITTTNTTNNNTTLPGGGGGAGVTLPGGYQPPYNPVVGGLGGTGSGFSSPSANVGGEGTGPGAAGTGVSTYGTVRGGGTVRAS